MTTTMTRRTALAGAAAGTLIPVAGLANATTWTRSAAESDPFIDAFCAYVDAEQAYTRSFDEAPEGMDQEDYVRPFCLAADAARLRMAQTVPTTPTGLMLAISALLPVFGEPKRGMEENLFDFDSMEVQDPWTSGAGEALLRSLSKGADRVLIGTDES